MLARGRCFSVQHYWRSTTLAAPLLTAPSRGVVHECGSQLHQITDRSFSVPIEADYIIGDEIQRGRYGVVWSAECKETARPVAIKGIDKTQVIRHALSVESEIHSEGESQCERGDRSNRKCCNERAKESH